MIMGGQAQQQPQQQNLQQQQHQQQVNAAYVPPHMRPSFVVQQPNGNQQGGQHHRGLNPYAPQYFDAQPSMHQGFQGMHPIQYQQVPQQQMMVPTSMPFHYQQQHQQVQQQPQMRQGFGQSAPGQFNNAFTPSIPFQHHHHQHHHNNHQQSYRGRFSEAADEAEVLALFESTGVAKGINFSQYEDIPVTCIPPQQPISTFGELDFPRELQENIVRCGYDAPTPVQKYTIPLGLAGKDIMACAQTGSGKTASFLLPVISRLLTATAEVAAPMFGATYPKCIVMAPTRELAIQIHIEARKFCYKTKLHPAVLYGGADIRGQLHGLQSAGGDIIVATPGRLWDVYQRQRIRFCNVRAVILDEADRMLDMGFEPQIRQIVQSRDSDMPDRTVRQTLMFSATFPREMQQLAQEFLNRNVANLTVGRIGSTTGSIVQTVGWVEEYDKMQQLIEVLGSMGEGDLTLVFVETKRQVEDVTRKLVRAGYHAACIHGDKAQNEREAALHSFKIGQRPVLVATDVASRGLDIPNVKCVVQYDIPHSIDDYVHRIGRTGRVGNEGEAISFFCQKNVPMARDLIQTLQETNQVVPDFMFEAVDAAAYVHQQKSWTKGGRGRGRGGGGGGGGHHHHHHQQQHQQGQHYQQPGNNYFSY